MCSPTSTAHGGDIAPLVTRLVQHSDRREAARTLAARLGADDLLLFLRDPEVGVLLPAPGFPPTMPGGSEWPTFVRACAENGHAAGRVPFPDAASPVQAVGVGQAGTIVLALLGGAPRRADIEEIASLLPLLAAALEGERATLAAAGQADVARGAAANARELVGALDVTRGQLQRALGETAAARERLALLADASAILAESLDYEATLRRLAQEVAARLGDWCVIDLTGPDAPARRVALAHARPALAEPARALFEGYRISDTSDFGPMRALRTNRVEHNGELNALNRVAHASVLGSPVLVIKLGFASYVAAPLCTRDRSLGLLTVARAHEHRGFDEAEVALLVEVARRAALAIDYARLFQEAREAVEVRDRFLSIASHELRTPVAGIKGYAQLLVRAKNRDQLSPERLARGLDAIVAASDRLGRLTQDLLDVSRLHGEHYELRIAPIDLADLVRRLGHTFTDQLETAHHLRLDAGAGPAIVDGDSDRLEQVVANLFENALKYSPDGGEITITLREDEDARGVYLRVTDEGIGIPPDVAEAIFEPFGRAPNATGQQIAGLGLGLYICRDIVVRHHGRIWFESNGAGPGTTFVVWLPLRGTS